VNIMHHLPKIINQSAEDMDALIRKIQEASNLNKEDQELITGCIEFATWLPEAIREKNISIRHLQRMLFGERGGKKKKKKNKDNSSGRESSKPAPALPNVEVNDMGGPEACENSDSSEKADHSGPPEEAQNRLKGHGRLANHAYPTAIDIEVRFDNYTNGDACPTECGGRLYQIKPGVMISIRGNALATVHRYHIEKLRCALCGMVLTAPLAPGVSTQKYDSVFKAQLALQKYYVAVPFYRQEQFQRLLGFPLPDATQFELAEDVADAGYPVVRVLERQAANGCLIQNDDTHVKILSVMQENKKQPDKERTGMYTSAILAQADGHTIALYYTGTRHAGENLADILRHRAADKPKMIQMCDASSMNLPPAFKTILCNCLGHGFRKFRDLLDFFPQPCLKVIQSLATVFKVDEQTQRMTQMQRFAYHRQHSKPILLELNRWLKAQLAEKKVEPNSSLGKAMKYLLKHWKALRRFLVVPGAPIDNNVVERALKIPIRVRKAAMFYKTRHGAVISNILTSLIVTAATAGENPFDYLVALQDYKSKVFRDPDAWTPWRYRETIEKLSWLKAA
jgi:transposase